MNLRRFWRRQRDSADTTHESRARLHADGRVDWGLEPAVLAFIDDNVSPESCTAETGAGHSTVRFAAHGCRHVAITPMREEIDRIRQECAARGIDDAGVRYCEGLSQNVLPTLELPPLDLVVIDGGHGLPIPFVDFCYLAPRLKCGGVLIVDDVHIWTGEVLAEFLNAEWNWKLVRRFGKACAFAKLADPVLADWGSQPYVMARSTLPNDWSWMANVVRGHIQGLRGALDRIAAQGDGNEDQLSALDALASDLAAATTALDRLRRSRMDSLPPSQ